MSAGAFATFLKRRQSEVRRIVILRLSEKSLEGSRRFGIAVLKVAKWCFWVRFDHSLEFRLGSFRNYQTVSPRTPVKKELLVRPLNRATTWWPSRHAPPPAGRWMR